MGRATRNLLFILTACILCALPARLLAADSVTMISLQSGHSVILRTPSLHRLAIGDAHIAGVVPIGSNQIVINGKAPGHTTVFVWYAGRRDAYEVTVTEQSTDDLAQMLRTSISEPNVQVYSFSHSIVVRGTVNDTTRFQTLSDILGRFEKVSAEQKLPIVNAVTIAHPIGDMQEMVGTMQGAHDIRVDPDGKGNVIVSGEVANAATEQAVINRVRGLAGPYLASEGKVVDRLANATISQISVKVYVLEVDTTALKNLGVQLQSATFLPNANGNLNQYVLGQPSFPAVEVPQPPGRALNVGPFFRTITLAPTLNLLLQEGHARILSSPNLVTSPGSRADFLVGGQIPIPFSTGLGQVSIQYKDFGVKLDVTPTILGNGSIETLIAPEVSNLDFANAITESGFVIPALKISRLSTDIVTEPGESIIMGGMVNRVEQRTISKIPLLGDIPVLGQLFRSVQYQSQKTDVVFVMTPEIITR